MFRMHALICVIPIALQRRRPEDSVSSIVLPLLALSRMLDTV